MLSILVTLWVAFQVQASVTAHQSLPPVRVIFLGSEWSAGVSLKPEEQLATHFARHLENFLGRKVEIRSVAVAEPAQMPAQLNALLLEKPADYVFYFVDHSGIPIALASEQMAPWTSTGKSFGYYLNQQIGAIRLATSVRKNPRAESILLNPLTDLMQKMSGVTVRFGAKFVLLWPGFAISPMSWASTIPDQWPVSLTSYLNVFKPKPRISSERLTLHLRRSGVPFVANLQISNYFSALRKENRDPQPAIWSVKAKDDIGRMLATSLVSMEF